jgi:flagellar transcriptional activator FlhD
MFRLKINHDMAERLLSLSARQLAKLSRTNQLLCRFNFDDAEQLNHVTQPREQDLSSFHGSLLLASQSASGEPGTTEN